MTKKGVAHESFSMGKLVRDRLSFRIGTVWNGEGSHSRVVGSEASFSQLKKNRLLIN